MSSVFFDPLVGGDGTTVTDDSSATTGLANGGHRTRFVPAMSQIVAIASWVKSTAATVLGYRDAASTSASNASTSAGNAATSATNAATTLTNFDKRYLGNKAADPTLDNQGAALSTGALYYNTSTTKMRVYTGSAWVDASFVPTAATGVSVSPSGNLVSTTVQAAVVELDGDISALSTVVDNVVYRGLLVDNVVNGTAQTALTGRLYHLVNAAATTVTLPAAPNYGDVVGIHCMNGLTTNVVARNGKNIEGLAEDLTIDVKNAQILLKYVDATYQWRVI